MKRLFKWRSIWELDLDQPIDFEEGAYSYDTKKMIQLIVKFGITMRGYSIVISQDLNVIVGINKSEKTLKWIIGNRRLVQ